MNKEETIKYIRDYDPFFQDANLEHYTFHELMLIKTSIDIEREKSNNNGFEPYNPVKNPIVGST